MAVQRHVNSHTTNKVTAKLTFSFPSNPTTYLLIHDNHYRDDTIPPVTLTWPLIRSL